MKEGGKMESSANPSLFRTIFGMMINPAGALKGALSSKWYLSVMVSALAFGLFFVQTGLDLYKTGQKDISFVLLSVGAGVAYGLLVIPLLAGIIWLILKVAKTENSLMQAVSSFCLSYSGALIYGVFGIAFSLILGWKTSLAFGITGVLWAIGPIIITIRELTGGKNSLSVPIAALVSAVVLISWSAFGNL